jgi:hypothetical protein
MTELSRNAAAAAAQRLGREPVSADDIVVMVTDVLYEYLPNDSGISAKDVISELLGIVESPIGIEIYEREMERRHPRDANRWH